LNHFQNTLTFFFNFLYPAGLLIAVFYFLFLPKLCFLLLEESTIFCLSNKYRIPPTLRRYNIAIVYVMQDKNQNDLVHGNRASKESRGHSLDFDTRVTTGEKEIPK